METVVVVLHTNIFREAKTGAKAVVLRSCKHCREAAELQGCWAHTCSCVATGHRWGSSSKELIMQEEEGGTVSALPLRRPLRPEAHGLLCPC